MEHQNKALKRQSQMLLTKMTATEISLDDLAEITEDENENSVERQDQHLNKMIEGG